MCVLKRGGLVYKKTKGAIMASVIRRLFYSKEWNVVVNFFAPAFDAQFTQSSILRRHESYEGLVTRYYSDVPLNLSELTRIESSPTAVSMSVQDTAESSLGYGDTIFDRGIPLKGCIAMNNAEGKTIGFNGEFRDADNLLPILERLFPKVAALHGPNPALRATLLRVLGALEEDSSPSINCL